MATITNNQNLSMLTDFYQLTMAYSAWKTNSSEELSQKIGVFDLYFRTNPFEGGYAVFCGLSGVLELIEKFQFTDSDCAYLSTLKGSDGNPLFESGFIEFLRTTKLNIDVDALEEGRVIFANEPILRMTGPIWQCQLLETPLLNRINFETLIATKSARVKRAAENDLVLEFGLRRAQGVDGGLSASRAAYIGGADATSNVLAGKIFGIPLKGTHAHSWVMSFDDERDAFFKFAAAMPNNSIFLVDTYDTLNGVKNAIEAGLWLKSQGHKMLGIRLDSGDLAYLSIEARKMLDEAGLTEAKIVASNDLDETLIESLKRQGAQIDIWGVGTKLVTAFDQPALGGVFKLVAMRENGDDWKYRIKISEQIIKVTTPGIHQVRRFTENGFFVGDMIFDERQEPTNPPVIVDPKDATRRRTFGSADQFEDLLKPVVRQGKLVIPPSVDLAAIRRRCQQDIAKLHPALLRLLNPHVYPVGLDPWLHEFKHQMVLKVRSQVDERRADKI